MEFQMTLMFSLFSTMNLCYLLIKKKNKIKKLSVLLIHFCLELNFLLLNSGFYS